MNLYLTDPVTKQPSVTLTLLITGFIICLLKMLVSGLEVGPLKLAVFGGGDFAAAVGSLGAIYWARRHTDSKTGGDDASS